MIKRKKQHIVRGISDFEGTDWTKVPYFQESFIMLL
jgi:hypothetical protein